MTRETYIKAHQQARVNRARGEWLKNPIRIADGNPGLWVQADGQVVVFVGFSKPYMWAPKHEVQS